MRAKTLVSTEGLSETEWLAYRTRGIGGSDVAAICGLSPFKSAVQVYLEKVGAAIDQEENSAMRWGKLLEPVIAEQFSRETGLAIRRMPAILQHPEQDWALANLDFLMDDPNEAAPGILEVKNTSAYLAKAWEEDEVPQHYILQLQWYLYVTGLKWGYFAPLIGGNRLLTNKRVSLDKELVEPMVKICSDFWQMVVLKTPPAPDGAPASTDLMKLLYPHSQAGKIAVLPDELAEELKRLPLLQEELKAFTDAKEYEIDTIKNKVKAEMKDAEIAACGTEILATWKESERKGYTVAPTTLRTFRLVKPKKEK
jgi:putative phage-type endonuclease